VYADIRDDILRAAVGLSLLLASAACATSTSPDQVVPAGTWGGEHALLTLTSASATIEFDCAHGALPAPLPLDRGAFDVAGDFFPEHGGPIRVDEPMVRRPARYQGTIEKQTMTLRVVLTDTSEDAGTFTLTFGTSGRVFKCV
jgi:hypothetical protein